MEFLRADYGSGSEEEGEVEEVKKGNSEQFQQDPIVGYSKGDRVIYMNSEECIVIEKHMDDLPNVYYTVQMIKTGRERQTTAQKLSPIAPETINAHIRTPEPDLNGLPPVVRSTNPAVQERVSNYLKMKLENGFDLTENIRTHKDFGNPKILSKTVTYFGIDEIGSNFSKAVFDPHGYREADYLDGVLNGCNLATQAPLQPTEAVTVQSRWSQQDSATTPIYDNL